MRSCISSFATLIKPLHDFLEEIYQIVKGTRRAKNKVQLIDANWRGKHITTFRKTKKALKNAVRMTHPDMCKYCCLLTYASDTRWSGVLPQMEHTGLAKPFVGQAHEQLVFISGSISCSVENWATVEKEAAAIIYIVTRLDYLLHCPQGFVIFTDNSNLVFILSHERSQYSLLANILNKVRRWGFILAIFNYKIA